MVIVAVAVAPVLGLAETQTVMDRGMVQLVREDQVPLVGQGRQDADIGMIAGVVEQGRRSAVGRSQGLLELVGHGAVAAEQARRGDPEAESVDQRIAVDSGIEALEQPPVGGKSEVVVGGQVQEPAAFVIHPAALAAIKGVELAQTAVFPQAVKCFPVGWLHLQTSEWTTAQMAEVRVCRSSSAIQYAGMT